jgi:ATP-dependent Clp protease ATP-binding subunit ClpB
MEQIGEYLKRRLTDVFRSELLNRFSKIIVFKDLDIKEIESIVRLNLTDLAELVKEQGIDLEFDDSAVTELARLGYDPAFGARPLRRAIDDKLRAPLAEKLLKKEIVRGAAVRAVFRDGAFGFVSG